MLDEAALQRTLSSAMEIWFEPEIRRRQETGTAPKPYPVKAAQAIFYGDGRRREIRLNEEVRALGEIKLKEGVLKAEGDGVTVEEIEEISKISLPTDEDPNCGHFTMLQVGVHWWIAFDFRYNKSRAAELLEAADEFFTTAAEALGAKRVRAAIDNLFSAAELAATAYVITTPFLGDKQRRNHPHLKARFNLLARDGNLDTGHRTTFNALSKCRDRARYLKGTMGETTDEIAKWKDDVASLIETVKARLTVR